MYKLQTDDIQGMIGEAARILTKPHDKEIMRRLVSSTRNTDESMWDFRLIAQMLAKAGKLHESEMVAHYIECQWERADAFVMMARALKEVGEKGQAISVLGAAVSQGKQAQLTDSATDRLDAESVLAEAACLLHDLGETTTAEGIAHEISCELRRAKVLEHIKTQQSVDADNSADNPADKSEAENSAASVEQVI